MAQNQNPIHYQIIGEDTSPKLIFLHGIMGQGRNWQSIAKNFSKNFQCLLLDQRGHGKSSHPESGYELKNYAQDLLDVLDELDWRSPIYLVGHSMGGRVALHFANENPERVEKLVIVDIGPTSDWASMQGIIEKVNFVPTPFVSRKKAREFFDNEFMAKYQSKMLTEFFYSNLTERNDQYDWTFSKQGVIQTLENSRSKDHWGEFRSLSMPTLLIRGGVSTDLPKEDFDKVVANNENIQGREVPGAGHWVHAEKPREVIRFLREFFNIAGDLKQ
jgi:pimeloyl-ACP methyl ester carboxylesterase